MANKKRTSEKETFKRVDFRVDSFGNILPSVDLDRMNAFLTETVKDRKLTHLQKEMKDN